MINLLPPDAKKELSAGRANRLLLRYLVFSQILIVVTIIIIGLFYVNLRSDHQAHQANVDANLQKSKHMVDSQKEVSEFRTNLATAKQILGRQVNYSAVTLRVASVIPNGVILDQLTLDPETVNKPVKLSARASDDLAVQRLKDALNASEYFSEAHYDTVSRDNSVEGYPFSITMTVTFTQELLNG